MCGILVTGDVGAALPRAALASLRRRGPDALGTWSDGSIDIVHTRLAVLGGEGDGVQPIENATHVLALNGEIYNFRAIRERLRAHGHAVRDGNDAEALLAAWTAWGPAVLADLEGFWAFVIYDKAARRLTLVRDQLGVKPLYYTCDRHGLHVASLLRTIREVARGPFELDYGALSEHVRYQITFGDKTFFTRVRKVLPGHLVEIDVGRGAVTSRAYDDLLTPSPGATAAPDQRWIDETRDVLAACVTASTIADAPLTALCSGGLDSALVTRLARPAWAFHCHYTDPDCDELDHARQVVRGTATRLEVVAARDTFDLVARLRSIVEDFDEPAVGSVVLPLDDVLARVRRRHTVVLTGTGGDELFAGYVRYQLALGHPHQASYDALAGRLRGTPGAAARFELTHRKGDPAWYRFYDASVEQTFAAAFELGGPVDPLHAMLRFDRRHFLPALLNIDDKLCGRHSLEGRPSLLHQRLVRRVNALDQRHLLDGGGLKPVLRRLGAGIVPEAVLNRRDKMGFTTPIGTFVNRSVPAIREQLEGSRFRDLYDLSRVSLAAEGKFSREVFGLLMLDLWLNRYAAATGPARRPHAAPLVHPTTGSA